MSIPLLHIPLDIEQSEQVRRMAVILARKLGRPMDECRDPVILLVMRLWLDWGRAGTDWRALAAAHTPEYDWGADPLTHIVESYCKWTNAGDGGLMKLGIEAGVLKIAKRGDLDGLELSHFWQFNEHLSPEYRSIQSRGGKARALSKQAEKVEDMAAQQAQLLEPGLFSEDATVTEPEKKKAVAMIMLIYMACGLTVPNTKSYSHPLINKAVEIIRRYSAANIQLVQKFIGENRDNAHVPKVPERIVYDFDAIFQLAN